MSSSATHLILTRWGYRDAKTGRWASRPERPIFLPPIGVTQRQSIVVLKPKPQQLWRFNYGLTFAVQGEYHGAVIMAWSVDRGSLERERLSLVDRLQNAIADFVGYEWGSDIGNDLWKVTADGEGFQQVPFDRSLEGSWEWWIEDDKGRTLKHDRGTIKT